MAIIPGVHVDFQRSPRIITIPVAGAPVDVSIADLQDTLQDIEDDEAGGILYPRLRDCSGGQSLGGGRFVGYTMQLQNAQVMFEPQTTPESEGDATEDDDSGTILTDSTATFVADGVERGHKIVNWTSGASSVVTEVISGTQLRHVVLSGGTRTTWDATDAYRVFPIVKCSVGDGNLTAVDELGNAIDPIMSSPNVFAEKESATSAALVEGSGGVTAGECADAVLAAPVAGRPPGSLGATVKTVDQNVVDAVDRVVDVSSQVTGVGGQVTGVSNQVADVGDIAEDLHDEALGRWVLNPTAKTLTLYRVDGSVLRTFNLTVAAGDVPPYVAREPAP